MSESSQVDEEITLSNLNLVLAPDKRKLIARLLQKRANAFRQSPFGFSTTGNCGALVALELKSGEFEPEYIGKMQFYLSVLDDMVRLPEDQPSIGVILCKSKDRLIVEYALNDATLPIGVSSYSVTPDVPSRLQGQLPSADQIASRLADMD